VELHARNGAVRGEKRAQRVENFGVRMYPPFDDAFRIARLALEAQAPDAVHRFPQIVEKQQ
jgi:hypothetical protein